MTLIDKAEAHDDDLIRRGDALDAAGPDTGRTIKRIAAIPARCREGATADQRGPQMTLARLIEAVGLALMKAGARLHRSKGFNYHKSNAGWRFLAASDPVRVLRDAEPEQRAAILRAMEGQDG